MLAAAGGEDPERNPLGVWEVFKRFATRSVAADAPERLDHPDGDLRLFEWGTFPSPSARNRKPAFRVNLCRQFSILDADGDYDRMEQLRCDIRLEATPALKQLGEGTIWSGPDLQEWFAAVEASDGFKALQNGRVIDIQVEQQPI